MQKRLPAPNISLEGNIYPITSMIYLEDHQARLSLLVDHATGASSQKQVRNIFFSIFSTLIICLKFLEQYILFIHMDGFHEFFRDGWKL